MMIRFAAVMLGIAIAGAAVSANSQQTIKLRVAGNLLATGLIQQNKEQPFFENLAKTTGLPLDVDYKPMDVIGIKDAEGLRVLKSGLFDVVSLRLAQVSRDERNEYRSITVERANRILEVLRVQLTSEMQPLPGDPVERSQA